MKCECKESRMKKENGVFICSVCGGEVCFWERTKDTCPRDRPCKINGCEANKGVEGCHCIGDDDKKSRQEHWNDKVGWAQSSFEEYH